MLNRGLDERVACLLKKVQKMGHRAVKKLKNAPPSIDWVGYETLIEFIEQNNILSVPGDLVEIGTFLGGGAHKLSNHLKTKHSNKTLYVIDVFDPNFDVTTNTDGLTMSSLYAEQLKEFKGKSQLEIFQRETRKCKNIKVLKGDSKYQTIPAERLCFGFIDGNHDPEYVENDFYIVWNKLSSGGAVGFHDYGGDLPQVTAKIDSLIAKHADEIKKTLSAQNQSLMFVQKS